jgi:hypothetical protein
MGRLPVLPPPITTAWVLASATTYSTTPREQWQTHDTPEEVFTNPEKWIDPAESEQHEHDVDARL